jgi:hypothetical protein
MIDRIHQREKARRGVGFSWLVLTLVVAAASLPLRAQFLMRQVNLAYLARRAGVVVQGRVMNVRYEGLPGYPHIPTVVVTVQVERMLRGPEGAQYTFRQWLMGREMYRGKGGYMVGQRLMLFLPSPSQYGLSSPLGHEQGRFKIVPDARGQETIANGYGNAGLFKGVAENAEENGAPLDEAQLRLAGRAGGAAPLREFVGLVDHLMQLPRIE